MLRWNNFNILAFHILNNLKQLFRLSEDIFDRPFRLYHVWGELTEYLLGNINHFLLLNGDDRVAWLLVLLVCDFCMLLQVVGNFWIQLKIVICVGAVLTRLRRRFGGDCCDLNFSDLGIHKLLSKFFNGFCDRRHFDQSHSAFLCYFNLLISHIQLCLYLLQCSGTIQFL